MLENMRRILLGDVLTETSREMLTQWIARNKTGAGAHGTANDHLTASARFVLVAVYMTSDPLASAKLNSFIANVGRIVGWEVLSVEGGRDRLKVTL
jgi:tryptophan synthase beta subunit